MGQQKQQQSFLDKMNLPADYKLIEYDQVDSTNIEAKRLIQCGQALETNLVITAKSQTAGKGRLGRGWVSEEGNLFVSVVIGKKPHMIKDRDYNIISDNTDHSKESEYQKKLPSNVHYPFLAAIAIGKTIDQFIEVKSKYKWPNDVLVEGRKISGVLIETIQDYIIFGMGINIASYPLSGTKLSATCLNNYSSSGLKVAEVLELLIKNFAGLLGLDSQEIMNQWTKSAYGLGSKVSIDQAGKEISGVFNGVDENGRLILDTKRGTRELVSFGDVRWI